MTADQLARQRAAQTGRDVFIIELGDGTRHVVNAAEGAKLARTAKAWRQVAHYWQRGGRVVAETPAVVVPFNYRAAA